MARPEHENRDFVRCRECGGRYRVVHNGHLATHGMTRDDYRTRYPGAQFICAARHATLRAQGHAQAQYLHFAGAQFDNTLGAFLVGSLLGDGCLRRPKSTGLFEDGGTNGGYIAWKRRFVGRYFPLTGRSRAITDRRSGARSIVHSYVTGVHPYLTALHHSWYADGAKRPARTLVRRHLDDLALAVWFYDDGHAPRQRNHPAFLSTDAFTREDVDWLRERLGRRFGIRTRLLFSTTGAPLIGIYDRAGKARLLRALERYPADGMEYKRRRLRDALDDHCWLCEHEIVHSNQRRVFRHDGRELIVHRSLTRCSWPAA